MRILFLLVLVNGMSQAMFCSCHDPLDVRDVLPGADAPEKKHYKYAWKSMTKYHRTHEGRSCKDKCSNCDMVCNYSD